MNHYTCIIPPVSVAKLMPEAPKPQPKMTWAEMAAAEGHMKRFPSAPTGEADKEEQKKPVSPAMKAVAKALRGNGQLDRHQIAKAARKVIQLRRERRNITLALDELDEVIRTADAGNEGKAR